MNTTTKRKENKLKGKGQERNEQAKEEGYMGVLMRAAEEEALEMEANGEREECEEEKEEGERGAEEAQASNTRETGETRNP
jgi:hypothetical protein